MWPFPKIDPPLEMTEKQKAMAMPWVKLLLGSITLGVVSMALLLAYMIYSGLHSRTSLIVVAVWYVTSELLLKSSTFICNYKMSRIAGDDGRVFRPRDWWWMFVRPFFVVAVFYLMWLLPTWMAKFW